MTKNCPKFNKSHESTILRNSELQEELMNRCPHKDRLNLESSKREATHLVQETLNKSNNQSLIRDHGSQMTVG